jgi:hypothetical protein
VVPAHVAACQESSVGCCVEELLPKHHTEAGRVSLYLGSFYFSAFPGRPEEAEDGTIPQKEATGALGSRSTLPAGGATVPQRSPSQLAGNAKPTN